MQAVILLFALFIFAVGKSPVFRVDRAGAAIIGAALTVATGVISFDQAAQAIDYRTIVLLFSMMIMASYLNLSGFDPAIVASLGAAFLLITRRIKPNKVYAGIDFNLIVIFVGLFVIIGGVEHSGLLQLLVNMPGMNNIQNLPVFSVVTVLLSNVVSNVPAVMLLKFLIPTGTGDIWWAAMAVFSTIAGNLTVTGSIANLIVVELAKKQNVKISFWAYFKIGFPLTVSMVTLALVYFTILTKVFHIS